MKQKIFLTISFFLIFIQFSFSQKTITGSVYSYSGELPGATVMIKNTLNGTETDLDGNYTITAKKGDVLVFSFIGYTTKEIVVDDSNVIDALLEEDSSLLDEIIVVAYGESTKKQYTGSVDKINSSDFESRPITNIINVVDGASAGLKVTPASGQPGSSSGIRIRGFGSVNASSSPLIILDGAEYLGGLSNLNPNDIESLSILKDAASTSLYGSRAANGVIIITTKTGEEGRSKFTVEITQGINTRGISEYSRVNAYQYYPLMWEAHRNGLLTGGSSLESANQLASDNIFNDLGVNPFNVPNNQIVLPSGNLNPNASLLYPGDLDWQKELVRTGIRSNINFSYIGGNEKTNYYMSLSYLKDQGYVINSDYKRLASRVKIETEFNEWFKAGINTNASIASSNNANDGNSTAIVNPFYTTRYIAPIYPVYLHNPDGSYDLDENGHLQYDSGVSRVGNSSGRHPIQETLLNKRDRETALLSAKAFADFNIFKDFNLTLNASLDKNFRKITNFDNPIVGDGSPLGRLRKEDLTTTVLNFNQLLKYNKSFGRHNIKVLLGHESNERKFEVLSGYRNGQIVEGINELVNFSTTLDLESYTRTRTLEGYFSNLTYNFDDKYYLSGSYRRDASSRFSKGARWGSFYSLGASWRLDQESFIRTVDWINNLKIRGSYGQVGNENLSGTNFYNSQSLYVINNNGGEPGLTSSTSGNPDLTWETNIQKDIALDFGLFRNRISGTVEFYERVSKDLLFEVPLPVSAGLDFINDNTAEMSNKGIEVDLNTKIIDNEKLKWNFNINASTLKNVILAMPQDNPSIIRGTKKLEVGSDIYAYWLRNWYGVDPADGSALYILDEELGSSTDADVRTINNTLVTTNQNKARYEYVGSAIPDLFGSFTNQLNFNGFELGLTFTYQIGGKTYDGNYARLMHAGNYGVAFSSDILNRWQRPGDITDVPRLDDSQTAAFGAGSSRWLVDSDFLALRQANFGYNFPKYLNEKLGINSLKVYLAGENLFIVNKRNGMEAGQNFSGTTSNRFSPSRVFTLGAKVEF